MTFTTITDLTACIEARMGVLDEEIASGRDNNKAATPRGGAAPGENAR